MLHVKGWWATPLWGAPGNLSYEQSVWVDGECVLDGLFGPAEHEIEEPAPDAAEEEGGDEDEDEDED